MAKSEILVKIQDIAEQFQKESLLDPLRMLIVIQSQVKEQKPQNPVDKNLLHDTIKDIGSAITNTAILATNGTLDNDFILELAQ